MDSGAGHQTKQIAGDDRISIMEAFGHFHGGSTPLTYFDGSQLYLVIPAQIDTIASGGGYEGLRRNLQGIIGFMQRQVETGALTGDQDTARIGAYRSGQ